MLSVFDTEVKKGIPWPSWGEKRNSSNMGGSQGTEIGLKVWTRCRKGTCIVPGNIPICCGCTDREKKLLKCIYKQLHPSTWYWINAG